MDQKKTYELNTHPIDPFPPHSRLNAAMGPVPLDRHRLAEHLDGPVARAVDRLKGDPGASLHLSQAPGASVLHLSQAPGATVMEESFKAPMGQVASASFQRFQPTPMRDEMGSQMEVSCLRLDGPCYSPSSLLFSSRPR